MSANDIFKQISQIIVQNRIAPSVHDGIVDKDYGELQLQEWETVNVAVERRADGLLESHGWKGMTLEVKVKLEGELRTVEQWYYGLKGQPRLSRRQVNAMYKALYTHLRLLPLFWLKHKSVPPLDITYKVFTGPPHRPLSSTHSQVIDFGDTRVGEFKLINYHLPDLAEVVHQTRMRHPLDFEIANDSTSEVGLGRSPPSITPHSLPDGIEQAKRTSWDNPTSRQIRTSEVQTRDRTSSMGSGRLHATSKGFSSSNNPHDSLGYMHTTSDGINHDIRRESSRLVQGVAFKGNSNHQNISPRSRMERDRSNSFGTLYSRDRLHPDTEPDGSIRSRTASIHSFRSPESIKPPRSSPVDIPRRMSPHSQHGQLHAKSAKDVRAIPRHIRDGMTLQRRADSNDDLRNRSLPTRLSRQQPYAQDSDFPFVGPSSNSPKNVPNITNRSPGSNTPDRLIQYGSSRNPQSLTPHSYGSTGSSNLKIAYLHGGNSPSCNSLSSLSHSRVSLHSQDDVSVGSSPDDDILMMDENQITNEELPFAIFEFDEIDNGEHVGNDSDYGNELEDYVEQFRQAPMKLSMFGSRLDAAKSIAHIEDDLQASRSELAMFDSTVSTR